MQNDENRVLSRLGARELSPQELEGVSGGLRMAAVCTVTVNPVTGSLDSDTHPC